MELGMGEDIDQLVGCVGVGEEDVEGLEQDQGFLGGEVAAH